MRQGWLRKLAWSAAIGTALSAGFAGCGEKKSDPAAGAPPPAKVETEQDVNLLTVDHPEQFQTVKAVANESTSSLCR